MKRLEVSAMMKHTVCLLMCFATFGCDAARINELLRRHTDRAACPIVREIIREVPVIKEVVKEVIVKECPCAESAAKEAVPGDWVKENGQPSAFNEPSQLGFTIELSENISVSHNVPITYDRVVLDSNDSFVPLLGTFQCPDDGVYMMYWSVDATQGRSQTSLMLQGEEVKYGPLTTDHSNRFSGTVGMASVMRCSAGASAWVRTLAWPDNSTCNQLSATYSTVSGVRIFSSDDENASAFTAELSQNMSLSESKLVYDHIIENIGEHYNGTSGVYTCPKTGIYVFSLSDHLILSTVTGTGARIRENDGSSRCGIIVNFNGLGTPTDTGTSTGTCLLRCIEGHQIEVEGSMAYPHFARTSSFSGFLLDIPDNKMRAFTARMDGFDYEFSNGETLRFSTATINVGSRFNSNSGVYTCDDNELYVFFVNIVLRFENNQRAGEVRIMATVAGEEIEIKRGPRTSEVLSRSTSELSSIQAVVRCQVGMSIYVQAVMSGNVSQRYYPDYTRFGGYKLPAV